MFLDFCWSNPYALKTFMNDLKLALSQIESFDILFEFFLYFCKNQLCM
jgi:hypothetical protein